MCIPHLAIIAERGTPVAAEDQGAAEREAAREKVRAAPRRALSLDLFGSRGGLPLTLLSPS